MSSHGFGQGLTRTGHQLMSNRTAHLSFQGLEMYLPSNMSDIATSTRVTRGLMVQHLCLW